MQGGRGRGPGRAVVMALFLWGCGGGPEVRVTADPLEWVPGRIAILPAVTAAGAIPPATGLPVGLAPSDPAAAAAAVLAAVRGALAGCATLVAIEAAPAFSSTAAGEAAVRLATQYLDQRDVDPRAALGVAAALPGTDALLLTAVVRYGPEADVDVARQAQAVNTKVGTTDLGISSAATHVSVWFNAQFRCALVRCRDGVVVWDVGERQRVKRSILRDVTQEQVLAMAAAELCGVFPWAQEGAGGASAP